MHFFFVQVRSERLKVVREEENKNPTTTPGLASAQSTYLRGIYPFPGGEGGSLFAPADDDRRAKNVSRGRKNPVLEKESFRLAALKRRQAMELQQMLTFQLRSLAREVRFSAPFSAYVCPRRLALLCSCQLLRPALTFTHIDET